jgi:pyroglutamyl-peptidase
LVIAGLDPAIHEVHPFLRQVCLRFSRRMTPELRMRDGPFMPTILVTGFGPYPGAPFNPTGPLVVRLARLRRPRLADANIIPHVFPTSFSAVDRDLPALLAQHKPDALLMFGLAPRARVLRIEWRARNAVARRPDAAGLLAPRQVIARGEPAALAMPAPAPRLLAAVRATRLPAAQSHDAGRFLCNYLAWCAAAAAGQNGGPALAAFVHVPPVRRHARPRRGKTRLTGADLVRAGTRLLLTLTAAARR